MKTKIRKRRLTGSIKNASLLRMFTVIFLIISLLPTLVLYYFYIQVRDYGKIEITEQNFNLTLTFLVLGVLLGYFTMRSVLAKLVHLIAANREMMENALSPSQIEGLTSERNELNVLTEAFQIITKRMEDNMKSLELAKKTLHSVLGRVGQGMSNLDNIDTFLDLIIETVTEALSGRVGVLMLFDEEKNELWVKTACGIRLNSKDEIRIKIDRGTTIYSVMNDKQPLIMSQPVSDMIETKNLPHLFDPPLVCVPMVNKEQVLGVISVSGKINNSRFENDEMTLLFNLASQTAVAIQNGRLNKDIERTYFETITALALAVDAKDRYSRGHLDRVAQYCVKVAQRLGLDQGDINTLRDAARLHDLGKIGIPDEILHKTGSLTEHERSLMQKHTEIGESIIKPIRSLQHLCDIIRHHHEKLDGSGYPDGLKGNEINPLVRIITITDIYDALTSERSYRNRFSREEAVNMLRSMKNELDQDLVETFVEVVNEI